MICRVELRTCTFSADAFEHEVRRASDIDPSQEVPDQVRYLVEYLRHAEMAAQGLLVEDPYVDRHFLTEFQGYYSTTLRPPSSKTVRIHVFDCPVELADLKQRLLDPPSRAGLKAHLQAHYLGFVVVRPLPTAPIGRTVLRWYRGSPSRMFGPQPPPHRVHLLGLGLEVHGVQFQQQDRAVGACATAAVWCALAATVRRDGGRSPTPLAVTEAANRSLPRGRALPAASGLTLEQMVGAINALACSPDLFKPAGDATLFLLQLLTYLRSGIPVVLQLADPMAPGAAHAVAVVGFRSSDGEEAAPELEHRLTESHVVRCAGITRLYLHDDRLGPYARFVWDPGAEEDGPAVGFKPYGAGFDQYVGKLAVWNAVAPLYPKIRISAYDLYSVASEVWPIAVWLCKSEDRQGLRLEPFFVHSGAYLESLYALPLGVRAVEAACSLLLSRYVGVLRFSVGTVWFLDVVCDATDVHREKPRLASVLVMLAADPQTAADLREAAEKQYPHVRVF